MKQLKVLCIKSLGKFDHTYTKGKYYSAVKNDSLGEIFESYNVIDDTNTFFRFYTSDFNKIFIEQKELRKQKLINIMKDANR